MEALAAPFALTDAGTAGGAGGDASLGGAFAAGASAPSGHAFGFLRRATPPGGFSVTSARHEERAAKTPW